jgi:hypothetical protein
MFEDYLLDSFKFYEEAINCAEERVAKRYYRGSVFYALSCMEAFINHISDTLEKSGKMDEFEISFLMDLNIYFDTNNFKRKNKIEFHKLEDKIKFLIKKFDKGFDFNIKEWSNFKEFKDFRNNLVHPKQSLDEFKTEDYKEKIRDGLSSIIFFMNVIVKAIFNKPLRKKLLDLDPLLP